MKKILFFIFFTTVTIFGLTDGDIDIRAHNKTNSQYIHAYQDMYVDVTSSLPSIMVNIGELVIITADEDGSWGFVEGSEQLITASIANNGSVWNVKFVVKDNRSFVQDTKYTITVDVGDGTPVSKIVTFNKEYVVSSVTINANSKYRELTGGYDYFKAGLNNSSYTDASLSITGMVHYLYDSEVFPSSNTPLSVELYISNDIKGVASIGSDGVFTFSNFSIPTISGQYITGLMVSVDLDGAVLYQSPPNKSSFQIAIDNAIPILGDAVLSFIPATAWTSEGTVIVPINGFFNRTNVSFQLNPGDPLISDGESGLSGNIWVVDPVNSVAGVFTPIGDQFVVTFSYNGVPLQGAKDLVIHVFDNVYNYVTKSVRVTIDVADPNEFVVTVQADINNRTNQLTPETGWYNDQTVSFNWAEPVDATGILAYQFKSEGWSTWSALQGGDVSLATSQTIREAWVTVDAAGNNSRTIWVRAIDKAGNIKTAYTTVKVDITPPTVSLQLLQDQTGKENVNLIILPQLGWYNDVNVRWFATKLEPEWLRDQPYQYRYFYGNSNTTTSSWVNTDVINTLPITPDGTITNNVFMLSAVDKAGNIGTVTAQVFVDMEDPVPSNFRISFDACTLKGEGVTPEVKWYNQTTVSLTITWDSVTENGEINRVMLYVGESSVPTIQLLGAGVNNINFNNISLIANDATPINFKVRLVDKAGNFYELNDFIYSDMQVPNYFQIDVAYDDDSNNDGLDPELGYYDNPSINFIIYLSQADPTARSYPFQFRVNNASWGDSTGNLYITKFMVSENICNIIEARYIDRAGNVLTSSFRVTVDTMPPLGSFRLLINTCSYTEGLQVTPDSGWYNKTNVSFYFKVQVGDSITDTFNIREDGYFLKGEADAYYTNGLTNSRDANFFLANGGALQRTVMGAIADRAGNIILSSANVYVDTDLPDSEFDASILDDSDSGPDGIWPIAGWHAQPYVNISWENTNDGAGSLHSLPYRVRAYGTTTWSAFQYQLNYSNIYVSPNNNSTQNVYIQVRDKAGNLATKAVELLVDITNPEAWLFVSPQIPLVGITYSYFEQEFNRTFPLSGWFNTENVGLTWDVYEEGGLPSKSFRVKALPNQYGASLDSGVWGTQLRVSADNHVTINLSLLVWDKAGNSNEATSNVKVDITPPVVSITMKSQGMSAVIPFVGSQDILILTLDISEPIVVTPFVRYTVTEGSREYITINNVQGEGSTWSCMLNMNSVTYDGVHNFSVLLIDDAGNIATTFNGYNGFVKLAPDQVQLPVSLSIQDIFTQRSDLTNANIVSVSFIVGTGISKYLILEGSDASSINYVLGYSGWVSLASEDFQILTEGRKYFVKYSFSNEEGLPQNGVRTLYLWVKNENDMPTMEAVSCDIILDKVPANVKIRPYKEGIGSSGNDYDGFRLAKSKYTAQLEITHNIVFEGEGYNYAEIASTTPNWRLYIYSDEDRLVLETVDILSPFISDTITLNNGSIWWAEYDLYELLGDVPATYNAYFEIIVTDEALNVTESAVAGGHFIIDTTIPNKPIFDVYSLDNKTTYTNTLTINFVLSKNVTGDQYFYYYIFDNYYGQPRRAEFQSKTWPTDGFGGRQVSFNGQYLIQDSSQGAKVIRAWVADSYYSSCLAPSEWFITYDSIAPTYEVLIQPINENPGNSLVVTLFFNERLDLSLYNKVFIEDYDNIYTVVHTANLMEYGEINNMMIYIITINRNEIQTRESALRKYISINVYDLAGNNLKDRQPFSRPLIALKYEDYFVRARRNLLSQYSNNVLEIGKKEIPVILAELKAVSRDVHLSGVNISLENIVESQIERFYIYKDQDQDGLFDVDVDLLVGSEPYQGGAKPTMNIPINEQIVNYQTTTTIFLIVDVNSGANQQSDYIGFGFVTDDPFDVAYYESVYPPTSQTTEGIVATFNIIKTLLNISYIPREQDEALIITTDINAGTTAPIKKFALRSWLADTAGTGGIGSEGALWTGLNLKLNYLPENPIQTTAITRIAIYKDNGNLIFDDDDLLVSSGTDKFLTAGQTTINIIFPYPVNIGGSDPEFFIALDIDKTLVKGKEFSFEIISADSFTFRDDDTMVDSGEFPIKTITFNSDFYVSQISVEKYINTERFVYQGEELNVLKFKLNVDYKANSILPKLYYIDIHREEGDIRLNDDVDVKLYKYSAAQADNDFNYTEEISVTVIDSIPAGERARITIAEGSNPQTNPQILLTENYYAIIIKPRAVNNVGKEGVFKIKFLNSETELGNISFQDSLGKAYGTLINEQSVTTNRIQILNSLQPKKPIITGNIYTDKYRNLTFYYSTSVNAINNGIDSLFIRIGSTIGGNDIYDGVLSVNNIENSKNINLATLNVLITNSAKFLNDNTTYNISMRARATQTGSEFLSITGNFSFHTDFTPPWVGNNNKLHVIPKWDEMRHSIVWSSFTEAESQIDCYIVEMLSGQSMQWVKVATNDRYTIGWNNPSVNYDTPYQYRVKAINAAGLHSEYLDSGERIMTTNTTEVIFNVSNYPNPFYSSFQTTRIVFSLNQDVDSTVTIYDSLGHFVRRYNSKDINKEGVSSGTGYFCYIDWDGRNESGQFVSKGGYFAVIEAAPYASGGAETKVVRMIGVIH